MLKRVRDLYAMSQDTGSPHEVAIAARRCRVLMDEHQVNQADLERSEFLKNLCSENRKRIPLWMQSLMVHVARVNDCQVQRRRPSGVYVCGLEHDALSATLMMEYLTQSVERQWVQHRQNLALDVNVRTAATNYRSVFGHAVSARLDDLTKERQSLQASNGRALLVVKAELVSAHVGKPRNYVASAQGKPKIRAGR